MTPRRPSPARPGARPGARSAGRTASRGSSASRLTPEPPGLGRRAPSTTSASTSGSASGAGSPRSQRPARPQASARAAQASRPAPDRREPAQASARTERAPREQARREESPRTAATIQADRPARTPRPPRLAAGDGIAVPARALILALVLLGAFVVTFPSLRGYLTQRAQYDAIQEEVRQAQATATAMEAELARWEDEDYVRTQARSRLSYVMPGETTYVVVGAEDFAETPSPDATAPGDTQERPWYDALRDSAHVAGVGETPAPPDPAQQGWSTQAPTAPPSPTDSITSAQTQESR